MYEHEAREIEELRHMGVCRGVGASKWPGVEEPQQLKNCAANLEQQFVKSVSAVRLPLLLQASPAYNAKNVTAIGELGRCSLAGAGQPCWVTACQTLDKWSRYIWEAAGKLCQKSTRSACASGSQAHKVMQRAAMAVTGAAEHRAVLQLPGHATDVQPWQAQATLNTGSRTGMQLCQ